MARWSRAYRALRLPLRSRVLDLGCGFGFGTRALPRRYDTYGHDLDHGYIQRAGRTVPSATFTHGPAERVPYADRFFDGVLLLDVLEHVPDDAALIDEIARLLRPGGQLILSVPNKGALAPLDSLNLYRSVLGDSAPAPTDDPSWQSVRRHRHYSCADVERLLGDRFRVRSVRYTGLGVAEIVNLVLLLVFRALLRSNRVYASLAYLYYGVYLLEDLLPAGSWGYHMMVDADRV